MFEKLLAVYFSIQNNCYQSLPIPFDDRIVLSLLSNGNYGEAIDG